MSNHDSLSALFEAELQLAFGTSRNGVSPRIPCIQVLSAQLNQNKWEQNA